MVFFFLLVAGLGYWYYITYYKKTQEQQGGTIAPSSTTAPATASPSSGGDNGNGTPLRIFAPYLLLSTSNASKINQSSRWTTLAFVVGYSGGKIHWDSGNPSASTIKSKGSGRIIVSFGGSTSGKKKTAYYGELAGKYTNVSELSKAYERVADLLGATRLDFDVEEDAIKDAAMNKRRNEALALLQKRKPSLKVHFTVPTEMSGIEEVTKAMLRSAKSAGVTISVVNLMTMYFAKNGEDMSEAAWKAVEGSRSFIRGLGAKIGITPMIGKNTEKPYTKENFTLTDAAQLAEKAKGDSDIALLSFWELGRDKGGSYATKFKAFANA